MAEGITIVGAADLYISPWRKIRRTMRERWLSWPWRPWRAWKYEPSSAMIVNHALKNLGVNPRFLRNEETLKAIDALAARATAAPWTAGEGDGTQHYDKEGSAKIMLWADEDCADHPVADFSANHTCREDATCEANAAFVAALVNAWPLLRASLTRVEEESFAKAIEIVEGVIEAGNDHETAIYNEGLQVAVRTLREHADGLSRDSGSELSGDHHKDGVAE